MAIIKETQRNTVPLTFRRSKCPMASGAAVLPYAVIFGREVPIHDVVSCEVRSGVEQRTEMTLTVLVSEDGDDGE